MTRRVALVALVALAAAGCGGNDEDSAREVLDTTASKLGSVRSGVLDLKLLATPAGERRGVGVELSGPFALRGSGKLPVARMKWSRVVGDQRVTGVLTSTGKEAFVTAAGRTVPLGAEAVKTLTGAASGGGSLRDLGLKVDRWIQRPRLDDGPRVDGVATDRITGELRTAAAVRDLMKVAGVDDDALASTLNGAVRSARAEIITGREDRIPRRVDLRLDLRPGRELKVALPGGGAVRLTARLELREPNRPVRVDRP